MLRVAVRVGIRRKMLAGKTDREERQKPDKKYDDDNFGNFYGFSVSFS